MAVFSLQDIMKTKYKVADACEGAFAAISDVLATIAMCITLDSVLKYLLLYTFNRGIIVTSAQILMVALYLSAPQKFYWLNSRARLRSRLSGTFDFEENTNDSAFDKPTHHVPATDALHSELPTTVQLRSAGLNEEE
ncbi:hypothetical protein BD410DRAFT_834976 [Rickenella mellea]|uniref:Uncharacterized protein n=1 Tax=Rickenella mellea TaxID=50990 RepID=A0A4Y7QNZ4_9AGAM|nr:hypothetical protein BD410DRAFT_834976 [Rickenella mellea]